MQGSNQENRTENKFSRDENVKMDVWGDQRRESKILVYKRQYKGVALIVHKTRENRLRKWFWHVLRREEIETVRLIKIIHIYVE